jgi:hypothetical protein
MLAIGGTTRHSLGYRLGEKLPFFIRQHWHAITVHPSLKEASGNYSAYFLKNPFA